MTLRHAFPTALAAGAVLALAGCGNSYDDSLDLYEQLRVEVGCDTVNSDDVETYEEGEVEDDLPAFEGVEGTCYIDDEDIQVGAFILDGSAGADLVESVAVEGLEGYGVHASNWVVLTTDDDEEGLAFAEAAQETLGGETISITEGEVEAV